MASQRDLIILDAFKNHINKTGSASDEIISRMITRASQQIENYIHRNIRRTKFTEFYDGNNTNKLFTRHYPIISVDSLWDDPQQVFGSGTLKASTDYSITKQSGIIELLPTASKGSTFSKSVRNVKIIYDAGWDLFQVQGGINDSIDFKEDGGAEISTSADGGDYTAEELAVEIQSKLNSAGSNTYTVVYNNFTGKFTITTSGTTIQFLALTGSNAYKGIYNIIGFDILADPDAGESISSDFGVLGIPADIQQAAILIVLRDFNESGLGSDQFDLKSKQIQAETGGGTTSYVGGDIPPQAKRILIPYKRRVI